MTRKLFFRTVILSLCWFAGISSLAQPNSEVDSLLLRLNALPDDTTKVFVYGRLARTYLLQRNQNDLAFQYADSMRQLAESLGYKKGVIDACYQLGGIEQFEGRYNEAIDYFSRYLHYYEQKRDSFRIVNALFAIGKSFRGLGDYNKSLEYFYRSIKICEQTDDREGMALAWNSISGIFRELGDYEKAIRHYRQAHEIYRELTMTKEYAMGLQNLGNVYAEIKNYDSASTLYEQALQLIRGLGLEYEEAIILGNLGELHEARQNYQTALSYQLQALEIRRKLPNMRSLTFGLLYVGKIYTKLGNPALARQYLKEGLLLAHDIRSKDLLYEIYHALADASAADGRFRDAYQFSEFSQQWRDSVFNENSARQINELQTLYETQKKDQQITILAREKELQQAEIRRQSTLKKAFIGGFILITLLAGSIIFLVYQRFQNQKLLTAKNEEIKEATFRQQLSDLEMKALRAQINPHFLFNCMNSINRMILNGEQENASRYLTKFSKLVRVILENSGSDKVSLKDELEMVTAYVQLEELRFREKIVCSVKLCDTIVPENTFLPPMILQPLVENAIWHGLLHRDTKDAGEIRIEVKEEGHWLCCVIEDNGVGRDRAKILRQNSVYKSKSMGLQITEERLRLLSKEKLRELIRITDLKDSHENALGTRVDINIPVS